MSVLYPRLRPDRAQALVESFQEAGLDGLREIHTTDDRSGWHPETGGEPIDPARHEELHESLRSAADRAGEAARNRIDAGQRFDRELTIELHSGSAWRDLPTGEAMHLDFWAWTALVLAPEIACKRFKPDTHNRFIAHFRNVFFRCWQRGMVLHDPESADPWHLLGLKEDQMVAILERPGLSANPEVARAIARATLSWTDRPAGEAVTRHALVRIRAAHVPQCLDLMDNGQLDVLCEGLFQRAHEHLREIATAVNDLPDDEAKHASEQMGRKLRRSEISALLNR